MGFKGKFLLFLLILSVLSICAVSAQDNTTIADESISLVDDEPIKESIWDSDVLSNGSSLSPGEHHVDGVNITGNSDYEDSFVPPKDNGSFNVPVNVVVDNSDRDVKVDIMQGVNGSFVLNVTLLNNSTGNVSVLCDGVKYPVPIVDYCGSISLCSLPVNSTITVFFDKIDVKPVVSDVFLDSNRNLNVFYLESLVYSVRVCDTNNTVLKGVSVRFTVAGRTYYASTDSNGVARVGLSLAPGKYTVTVFYGDKTVSNKITVKQIIAAKKTTNVKKSKKRTVIPITVKGHNVKQASKVKFVYNGKNKVKVNFGKSMKTQSVNVKFKGKTYKVKVNSKGKGTLKLAKNVAKKLKKGKKYTAKVTYKGPKLYKKVKVTVKFNGKNYKVKTNSLGVGKFKVTKKMVKKLKKGKRLGYTIAYKQASLKRFVKIK